MCRDGLSLRVGLETTYTDGANYVSMTWFLLWSAWLLPKNTESGCIFYKQLNLAHSKNAQKLVRKLIMIDCKKTEKMLFIQFQANACCEGLRPVNFFRIVLYGSGRSIVFACCTVFYLIHTATICIEQLKHVFVLAKTGLHSLLSVLGYVWFTSLRVSDPLLASHWLKRGLKVAL